MSLDLNTAIATQNLSQNGFDAAVKKTGGAKTENQIAESARDFEAMFIAEMMKPMFEGIEVDETFGGGKGEEVFRGQMLQEYGKMIAQTGQLGIADSIMSQMIEMQSIATKGGIDAHNRDILKESSHVPSNL